jgi:hypothetical protein
MKQYRRSRLVILMPALLLLGALFTGCGDDGKSEPDLIAISDFEGSWVVQQYKATLNANPQIFVELISSGGAFEMDIDDAGVFQGRMFIPASLAGTKMEMPIAGTAELISQDSLLIDFTPEIPGLLTETRAEFTLTDNKSTVTLTDANSEFDFGGGSQPATFEGIMVKNDGSYPPIVFTEDFEGFWEAVSYTATSVADPQTSIETISMGATWQFDVDDQGQAIGDAFIPGTVTGGDDVILSDFVAAFELIYQDTMMIVFDPEVLPFLVNTGGYFTLDGNDFTLTDESAYFDFGSGPVPAIAEIVMERTAK